MDKGGRIAGMCVFIIGVALLILVFGTARGMFAATTTQTLGGADKSTAVGMGAAAVGMFVRIGLLFVMTLAGSLVAARGVHLYLGSSRRADKDADVESS